MPGLADEESSFLPAEIIGWESLEFDGRTAYTLAEPSASGTEHDSVQAKCENSSASGLILERPISLEQTPILEWRWRVDSIYEGIDETEKSGDDYPARIYVVAERWPRFRSRVVNYVWSSSQPRGAAWDNAFPRNSAWWRCEADNHDSANGLPNDATCSPISAAITALSPIPSTPWQS